MKVLCVRVRNASAHRSSEQQELRNHCYLLAMLGNHKRELDTELCWHSHGLVPCPHEPVFIEAKERLCHTPSNMCVLLKAC